jgi:hypothetical protein
MKSRFYFCLFVLFHNVRSSLNLDDQLPLNNASNAGVP